MNVLMLWDIPKSKILAIVTDNDSTMLKAVKDNFGENKPILAKISICDALPIQ